MMSPELTDVFNECIDRLRAGQSLDDCLHAYPDRAGELRPLLEAALIIRRASPGIPPAARDRVRARVMQAAGQIERQQQRRPTSWLPRPGLALAASLAAVILVGALMLWTNRDNSNQGLHIQTLTSASLSQTAAVSPTVNTATVTTAPATDTPLPTDTPTTAVTSALPVIATVSTSPTPAPTTAPICVFTVTVSSANLREGPGTGYNVAGFGYRDEKFTVIARHTSNVWFQVKTADEREVWIASSVGEVSGGCDDLPVSTLPQLDGGTEPASPTPGGAVPTVAPALPSSPPADDSHSDDDSGGDSEDDHPEEGSEDEH